MKTLTIIALFCLAADAAAYDHVPAADRLLIRNALDGLPAAGESIQAYNNILNEIDTKRTAFPADPWCEEMDSETSYQGAQFVLTILPQNTLTWLYRAEQKTNAAIGKWATIRDNIDDAENGIAPGKIIADWWWMATVRLAQRNVAFSESARVAQTNPVLSLELMDYGMARNWWIIDALMHCIDSEEYHDAVSALIMGDPLLLAEWIAWQEMMP